MPYYQFIWSDEAIEHLDEHGVSTDEFEAIVTRPAKVRRSRSSRRLAAFGRGDDGRNLICLYDLLEDGVTIIPATAYEV